MSELADQTEKQSLEHFPVSFFAITMGFGGLTIATEKLEQMFTWPHYGSLALLGVTSAIWLATFFAYSLKVVRYPEAVAWELNHPIRLSFFPTSTIGLLLIAIATIPFLEFTAQAIWWVGVVGQFIFLLVILDRWFHKEHFQTEHNSPAWFIPIVGNILVPIAGMHFGYVEISFLFFSIGLVFWLPLMAISLNRSFFFAPLPKKLLPTQFILIAPPAVAFLSWISLKDTFDDFAVLLYYFALFAAVMTISQAKRFLGLQFSMPWWAFSFPLAAVTIASFAFYARLPLPQYQWIALSFFVALVAVMGLLVFKTTQALVKGKLLLPE